MQRRWRGLKGGLKPKRNILETAARARSFFHFSLHSVELPAANTMEDRLVQSIPMSYPQAVIVNPQSEDQDDTGGNERSKKYRQGNVEHDERKTGPSQKIEKESLEYQ